MRPALARHYAGSHPVKRIACQRIYSQALRREPGQVCAAGAGAGAHLITQTSSCRVRELD